VVKKIHIPEDPPEVYYTTIKEATAEAIRAMSLDAQGWDRLGSDQRSLIMDESVRRSFVRMSRWGVVRDPLCKQSKELWTNFGLGKGVTWQTQREDIKQCLDTFVRDKKNKIIMSGQGQRAMADTLFTDGELPFIIFDGNPPRIRPIDSLEIIDIGTHPDDEFDDVLYKREWYTRANKLERMYYRSVNAEPGSESNVMFTNGRGRATRIPVEEDAAMFHFRLGAIKGRGVPGLMASLDWIEVYRQFMRSRVSIQQALAKVARKIITKGGAARVANAKQRDLAREAIRELQSQTPPTGKTRYENENERLETMPQETGAQAAQVDGAMLLQVLGAGVGIYPHYFGAGEAFRLATATAMETPMLRTFESEQALLESIFLDIFTYVCKLSGIDAELGDIIIEMPPIFNEDRNITINSMLAVIQALPELAESEDVIKKLLQLLAFKQPDQVYERYKQIQAAKPQPDPFGASPVPGAAANLANTLNNLEEALRLESIS
jgi:hypothetical protein